MKRIIIIFTFDSGVVAKDINTSEKREPRLGLHAGKINEAAARANSCRPVGRRRPKDTNAASPSICRKRLCGGQVFYVRHWQVKNR
jgi:hypothetical protein